MRGLKYISWADNSGYAVAAKSYIRALVSAGVELTWLPMLTRGKGYEPVADSEWGCPRLNRASHRPLAYDTVLIHTVPDYFPAMIERERAPGRRIFGYTVWELERLPEHWPDILNRLDGVIVPCRWNAEVFRASGVTVPIHVVPHLSQFEGLEPVAETDRLALRGRLGRPSAWRDRYIFYTVGFWMDRKALDLTLEAYWRAFTARDPVLMIVKTSAKDVTRRVRSWRNPIRPRHPRIETTIAALARRHPDRAPMRLLADHGLSDGEIRALHEMGDCYVSLARTEGWGMGVFEAASLGRPVVTTGYGGQTEFLDPESAWLVDYRLVPARERAWAIRYRPDDLWAEPSLEHAVACLREIVQDQEAARRRGQRLAERIQAEYAGPTTVRALVAALQ